MNTALPSARRAPRSYAACVRGCEHLSLEALIIARKLLHRIHKIVASIQLVYSRLVTMVQISWI